MEKALGRGMCLAAGGGGKGLEKAPKSEISLIFRVFRPPEAVWGQLFDFSAPKMPFGRHFQTKIVNYRTGPFSLTMPFDGVQE